MGQVSHFKNGDGEAFAWRDDPATMITRLMDDSNSPSMGCGYLTVSNTKVESTIDFDELLVVLSGHFRSRCGDQVHECSVGDVLWIHANTTFTLESDNEARLLYVKYPAG